MAEVLLASLFGFLIGRGIAPKDAEGIVEALRAYLGFEPPLGLTGYALEDMTKGKEYNSAVVVRGRHYDVIALEDIRKHSAISVLGKKEGYIEVAPTIESLKFVDEGVKSTGSNTQTVSLAPGETKTMITIDHAGENLLSYFYSNHQYIRHQILCDGVPLKIHQLDYFDTYTLNAAGFTANTPGVSLLRWSDIAPDNIFIMTLPYRWGKKLELKATNPTAIDRPAITSIDYQKRS